MIGFFTEYPYLAAALRAVIVFSVLMSVVPLLVYFERRICAWIQDRIGPNRVGPLGLLQPLADVIKLLFKEDLTPDGIDRWIYTLAPALVFVPAMVAFAVIPVGMDLQVADLDIGVVFLITIGSFGVYGLAFGGWASNNKFSLLGGLRASAQMISYEVALGLALISAIMMSESLNLDTIVRDQWSPGLVGFLQWNIFQQPVAALILMVSAFAETNRLPFDLPECESELVGGFHTEYSSMKFAMFFLGEYIAMVTMSALVVTLFLGGWHVPFLDLTAEVTVTGIALSVLIFSAKVAALLFLFIWVRWTLPRFRYDQLMRLGWKVFIPLALGNICLTALGRVYHWNWLIPLPFVGNAQ
ncbi:MAG: NADH-quinone oxidoreductase subunit NuoH [Planctomycetota bacterium]